MFQNIAGMLSYMALNIGRLFEIIPMVENISLTAKNRPITALRMQRFWHRGNVHTIPVRFVINAFSYKIRLWFG